MHGKFKWCDEFPTYSDDNKISRTIVQCDNLIPIDITLKLSNVVNNEYKPLITPKFETKFCDNSIVIKNLIDPSLNCNWYNNDLKHKQKSE